MGNLDIHIGEILARNARLYPNDVALIERVPAEGKRREITWKQFDEQANRFANGLMQKGIKKGDKVVHLMMNSLEWLIAYFGIIRTGAWAVPLNFRFSGSDIKYCCEVAEPQCMVFSEEFSERVTGIKDELPTVKDYIFVGKELPSYAEPFERLLEKAPSTPSNVHINHDDPCGLYFTSGTTGQPKPILLTHKNMICACITENAHHYQTRKDNFILSWSTLNSFTLSAMPLFIFMGCILGNCGVNEYLFSAVDKWTGNLTGGLVCSVIGGNAIFAAMCGSTMAATATFGKIAFPVMEKKGYDPSLSLGSIAAGSVLAPLIPPSIIMIIYGSWQGISIVDLLAAGLIPGVILTVLFIITVMVRVKLNPALVPPSSKYTWSERIAAIKNVLPFAGLIIGVLGSIFFGLMTPTEAAGLGAFLSILLTIAYRKLTWAVVKQSLLETTSVTSFSLFIMAMASLITHVFNSAGIIPLIKTFVISLPVGKYTILVFFFVMYFFMGMLFDSWSMLFLSFPFVMPIIVGLGFNPIWWGVIYVMAAEQGTITPPFGLSLFVLHSVVPQYSIGTIVRGALPFLIPIYFNIFLLILFPQIALWLPRILSGG